jgi:hypothetical protein
VAVVVEMVKVELKQVHPEDLQVELDQLLVLHQDQQHNQEHQTQDLQ